MTDRLTIYNTISLGALIDALKQFKPDDQVRFDFGYMCPTYCDSYRGYYDHLAVGYAEGTWPSVHTILEDLRSAIGRVFEGYKGGDYRMSKDTPVWVSNYGDAAGTTIVDVEKIGGMVVIKTSYSE